MLFTRLFLRHLGLALLLLGCTAAARSQAPAPQDRPYPGTIKIAVDATDIAQRIFRVRETVPVEPGPVTLLYPRWLPGWHSPRGPIERLAGLEVRANGRTLAWQRDPMDVHAFRIQVPEGVRSIELAYQYLSVHDARQDRVVFTPEMLNLQWHTVSLYPAGWRADRIPVQASVTYPAGWQAATALEVASSSAFGGNTVQYKPVDLDTLIDSPVMAGKHFKRVELNPGAAPPVFLDIFADEAKDLEAKPEQLQPLRELVQQALKLYGAHHFDHYDFLLALSDKLGHVGLEHHRSTEINLPRGLFTDGEKFTLSRDVFSHELVHSWNGKFRRGVGQAVPHFNQPLDDSQLWMYEGQTQFWGNVLSARAGLWKPDEARDTLAWVAAQYDLGRPGLAQWRSLQDTTNEPVISQRRPQPWRSWQGGEDYYMAGVLIWLEVDGLLRQQSGGARGLDDFAKSFFGMDSGRWTVRHYDENEIIDTLNAVQPHDWARLLRERLDGRGPLDKGLVLQGWKLAYTDQPNSAMKAAERRFEFVNHSYSLGLVVGKGGELSEVLWDSPAFKAGLAPNMKLIAVNGREYKEEVLKQAIAEAAASRKPLQLLVKRFDEYLTVPLPYYDGLRYPHLVRDESRPDGLGELLKPR